MVSAMPQSARKSRALVSACFYLRCSGESMCCVLGQTCLEDMPVRTLLMEGVPVSLSNPLTEISIADGAIDGSFSQRDES